MRINTYNRTADAAVTTGKAGGANGPHKGAPNAATSSASTAGAVKVAISSQAQALAASSSSDGIDSAKVDRLKSAISSGSFQVDSGAIANKIVNEGE